MLTSLSVFLRVEFVIRIYQIYKCSSNWTEAVDLKFRRMLSDYLCGLCSHCCAFFLHRLYISKSFLGLHWSKRTVMSILDRARNHPDVFSYCIAVDQVLQVKPFYCILQAYSWYSWLDPRLLTIFWTRVMTCWTGTNPAFTQPISVVSGKRLLTKKHGYSKNGENAVPGTGGGPGTAWHIPYLNWIFGFEISAQVPLGMAWVRDGDIFVKKSGPLCDFKKSGLELYF